jgi:hypothetical protein
MKPTPERGEDHVQKERRGPVSATFVQFTNSHTNAPAWVNPDHVRSVQPMPGRDGSVRLAMGGEKQDLTVKGDLKSVLEILRGEIDGP